MAQTRLRRFGQSLLRIGAFPLNALSRLTRDGTVFLLLSIACSFLSLGQSSFPNIPLMMSHALLALWLLALWQGSRALKALAFKRSHVERVFASETLNVTIHLQNQSRLPCAGITISERLETERPMRGDRPDERAAVNAGLAVSGGSAFFTVVPSRGSEVAQYSLRIRRRGIYRFGDTRLETVFPLGFFRSASVRHAPGRLVIYPRLGEVDSSFFEELELALRHMRTYRPSRAEEDFRGLREYRHGDNPRWIHWRSTARTHKVLIKEYEEPQARRVLLLLDTNLQRVGSQRFASFELAISFVGTIARDLARRGYELDCVALQPGGRHVRTVISRERRNLDSLLEMLAALRRDDTRTLDGLRDIVGRRGLDRVYVLVLGLGSLRAHAALQWLYTRDNVVKVFDARGDEFRRAFRPPGSGSVRDQFDDEDMLLEMSEEESTEEPARV